MGGILISVSELEGAEPRAVAEMKPRQSEICRGSRLKAGGRQMNREESVLLAVVFRNVVEVCGTVWQPSSRPLGLARSLTRKRSLLW
jgi:hypothetical protein